MNNKEYLKQLIRYGIVGIANTLLTFVSYWIFRYSMGSVDWANGLSYALGMMCSFLLNKRWTFRSNNKTWHREALFFFMGSALCWCVQWMVFRACLKVVPEVLAQLVGMVVYTLFGFLFNKKITFK